MLGSVNGENKKKKKKHKIIEFASEMELRDHFAGLAMQGLIASDDDLDYEYLSSVAYLMADAMIEKRNNNE
jgi:hypothetical protein